MCHPKRGLARATLSKPRKLIIYRTCRLNGTSVRPEVSGMCYLRNVGDIFCPYQYQFGQVFLSVSRDTHVLFSRGAVASKTHARALTYTHSLTHTHTHSFTQTLTHTHTHTRIHIVTHIVTHTLTHIILTLTLSHTLIYIHSNKLTHTLSHTHTPT